MILVAGEDCAGRGERGGCLSFSSLRRRTLGLLTRGPSIVRLLRGGCVRVLISRCRSAGRVRRSVFHVLSESGNGVFVMNSLGRDVCTFQGTIPGLFGSGCRSCNRRSNANRLVELFGGFHDEDRIISAIGFVFDDIVGPRINSISCARSRCLVRNTICPRPSSRASLVPRFRFMYSGNRVRSRNRELSGHRLRTCATTDHVRRVVGSGVRVFSGRLNTVQPIRCQSVIILVQGAELTTPIFRRIFRDYLVPISARINGDCLGSPRMRAMLDFLRVVSGPERSVPLVTIVHSPL